MESVHVIIGGTYYLWDSQSSKRDSTSAGTVFHFARPDDAKSFHAELKGQSVHAEQRCGAVLAGDSLAGGDQCRQDVRSLDCCQVFELRLNPDLSSRISQWPRLGGVLNYCTRPA